MSHNVIRLRGARQNNLKNLDLALPLGEVAVVTGPSGSGKRAVITFDVPLSGDVAEDKVRAE